jgi:hypothetical protein
MMRAYGNEYKVRTVMVYERDEVVAILPPSVKQNSTLYSLDALQSAYAAILCEECRVADALPIALSFLLKSVFGWHKCVLQHVHQDSRLARYCKALMLRQRLQLVLRMCPDHLALIPSDQPIPSSSLPRSATSALSRGESKRQETFSFEIWIPGPKSTGR